MAEQEQEPLVLAIKTMISAQVNPEVSGIKRAVTESKQIVEQMRATLTKQKEENEKAIAEKISAGLASVTSAVGKLETIVKTLEASLTQKIDKIAEDNSQKHKKLVDHLKAIT